MAAVIKSEHSYEEIMAFIIGGSSEDEMNNPCTLQRLLC